MVRDPDTAARRLEDEGWALDRGQEHEGQGTRNRRLPWESIYFELLWIDKPVQAESNPLRLDRRAEWQTSGASPVGLGFRGRLDSADREEFWPYDVLGSRIWIHHDNEHSPERPLVFAMEMDAASIERRRSARAAMRQPDNLREVRVNAPSAPFLPAFVGPPVRFSTGPHQLELTINTGGKVRKIGDGLLIRV